MTTAHKSRIGTYRIISTVGEEVKAYIPPPLPPDPPVDMNPIYPQLEHSARMLGDLSGLRILAHDPELFLVMNGLKEALLSSQIEGSKSTLSDLLLFETVSPTAALQNDTREIHQLVEATQFGLRKVGEGFPICVRLMRDIHRILLSGSRGQTKQPGQLRRSQNWIGGTRPGNATHVPPPPQYVPELMSDLEKFIHAETPAISPMIKTALVHAQFETIHPFLDGNGRVGRLLILLMLIANGSLRTPVLGLSLFFKKHRQHYYNHLMRIRTHGDWEGWIAFFLRGVAAVSAETVQTGRKLHNLFEADKKRITTLGRAAANALRVHLLFQESPIRSISAVVGRIGISRNTASSAIKNLQRLGIVTDCTPPERRRYRRYEYGEHIRLISPGTDPID